MRMKWRNRLAMVVLGIGSLQMVGYVVGSKLMRGVGMASGVAPFTKVFCAVDGYEAFAARYYLEGTLADGTEWSRRLDPEWYSRLEGSYNRRNVYGAAVAFAPRMSDGLRECLLDKCLSPEAVWLEELGVPEGVTGLRVRIVPREGEVEGPWVYQKSER